ncbi:metal-sensitive transcriptional regulator [Meiothermus sp. QL-1]|uniref:metal-sensitive transcriptional regulator n=1 Tax=Meiothermus sp. QL-1 TaxID=2058095 RepID=UPI000E0C034F|nr:metal-sensitive transcriptional regulator [Meiothermus sp. QL-1]RDI95160.1 metal-sensitive transcriptional regulator [Meiothermus sp. QL-1]
MNTSQLNGETLEGILKRLRRIEGQVRGLQRMVEEGRSCEEVLTQMTAAKRAMESASALILQEFLTLCANDIARGDHKKPAQIAAMLRRFVG